MISRPPGQPRGLHRGGEARAPLRGLTAFLPDRLRAERQRHDERVEAVRELVPPRVR